MVCPVFCVQMTEMMQQGKKPLGLAAYQQKRQTLKNKPENSTVGKQSTDRWESLSLNFFGLMVLNTLFSS